MNRFYASLFALALPLIPCNMNAQAVQKPANEFSSIVSYMKRAMAFNQQLPQEKVYLHFDNTGYFKGETIWFKAYVVRADKSTLTDMSRVLYVELVNPSGDVIDTRKYQIKDGVADGCLDLTDKIFVSGYYEVRAYTRYMVNWGNGGIFSRVFPVFDAPSKEGDYSNPFISTQSYKKRLPNIRSNDSNETKEVVGENQNSKSDKRLCVNFYPEGGHLIKGLNSRVAFLVTDNTGASQELGGLVLDENKEVMTSVVTRKGGRGVFELNHDGKPKYLRIADADGKQHDFLLPEPEAEGLSLNMNMLGEDVTATVSASPSMVGKLLGYTLMHNGNILIADTVCCEKMFAIPFDRQSMPSGVSQLTFFTSDGHIQAERQFFIYPRSRETDSIRITSPMKYTKPCGKIVLNLKAQPNSHISVSAMDAETMVNGKDGNALTWMLLSSEIKGYIHNPSYYFESDDREHRLEADLLMMVQGWRRYDWALMANAIDSNEEYSLFDSKSADFHQPLEDALYIYGTLKEKSKKYDVSKAWLNINLYSMDGTHFDGQAKVDSSGYYAFEMPEFYGELKTIFNTGVSDKNGYWKDASFYVGIDRRFSPARRLLMPNETKLLDINKSNMFNDPKALQTAQDEYQYVKISKREHVLPTVVITARKKLFEKARAAWQSERSGRFFSQLFYDAEADADMFADKGMQVPTLWEWLNMRNSFFSTNTSSNNVTESAGVQSMDESSAPTSVTSLDGDMNSSSSMSESDLASSSDKGLNGEDLSMDKIEGHGEFEDGLAYKNRPIIWVLNNAYCAITHLGGKKLTDMRVMQSTVESMPLFIDEVKSVYVSEDPKAYSNVLMCSDLTGKDPVTVFVYTYASKHKDKKGTRTTIFKGYNTTKTFEMEDYSIYPPMEDFRRTVFWAPNVVTDNNGNARLEFWNNSSVHSMYISAEGVAPNGNILVNE